MELKERFDTVLATGRGSQCIASNHVNEIKTQSINPLILETTSGQLVN